MSSVADDVSRARDEQQRAQLHALAEVLEALPVGVYIAHPDGTSMFANSEARRLTGLTDTPPTVDDVLSSLTLVEGTTGHPYPRERMPLSRALAGESSHAIDMGVRHASGQVAPLELWGTPVRAADGSVKYAIVTMADISAHKQAEHVMAEQAMMLNLSYDAVIVWEPDGGITFWNRGAEATYGFTREQAAGSVVHDLLRTVWPQPLESILDAMQHDGQWEGELEQRRADGSLVIVNTRWAPHYDADGTLVGTMEINRDITARKDAEKALAQRAAELEVANRDITRSNEDLEQFAYVASHDLAEPLRAIRLPLSMLARRYEGQLGADADEYIGFAVDGCTRMQKMIEDLLRWSRVGRIEEDLAPVDCAEVVGEVLEDLQQAITDAGATVEVGALPTVTAVRGQVVQVFQNLISNAVKFVAPGVDPHVVVAAERDGELWRITVTDNGIGVEPRHRERIFGMFKRLHARDEYPGTGIGLALTKKAVERHGGQIGVEDTPTGTGTRFWFTLPESPAS